MANTKDSTSRPSGDVDALLGTTPRRRLRRALVWAVVVLLVATVAVVLWQRNEARRDAQPRYQLEEARRGNLLVSVTATGRLQPTNQVDVGSELSGILEKVLVDANDRVARGQVIARLDLSKLNDQVIRSQGALAAARAQVLQTQATVEEARASLARLQQVSELSGGKVPSRAEMQTAEATLKRALANEANAKATVDQAAAQLKTDQTNVVKASIRSPIDGVVLTRKVEPGQTVAATLQAPVLFTIAEDLAQMKLEVDVDEADVGAVTEGQPATFSVDAYPGRRYPSQVTRVGFGSQTKDNVVSYLTLLSVRNDDLSLRPGMTATAQITTAERNDVLLVPNAALRWNPPADPSGAASDKSAEKAPSRGVLGALMPRPPQSNVTRPVPAPKAGAQAQVWVLRDGRPVAVRVKVGVTDGRQTEIAGGELQPGTPVIVDSLGTP